MKESLIQYSLHLADNALILGQRNSEWCGHGPVLEQDIAITNISLDLIGQTRNFYQYAARLINESPSPQSAKWRGTGNEVTEDSLAYLRTEREFKNCLLVEQPNGDWAKTILRQFFFSAYQYFLYQNLQTGNDEQLAAIAAKSLKEVTYHLRWSSEWVIRLGDGTGESHTRMLNAVNEISRYTNELFIPASYEKEAAAFGIGVDVSEMKDDWQKKIKETFEEAALSKTLPFREDWVGLFGKEGKHTEHLGYILAEMQYMQRTYPGVEW